MTLKCECDICNKITEDYIELKTSSEAYQIPMNNRKIDLCFECYFKKLIKYIKKLKKECKK